MSHYTRNKKTKYGVLFFLLVFLATVASVYVFDIPLDGLKNRASVFFIDSITEKSLLEDFAKAKSGQGKIKILIVPGHDNKLGGTKFNGVREYELNIELAENLTKMLRKEPGFEVTLTRNKYNYNENIQKYISKNYQEIKTFRAKHKDIMDSLVRSGLVDTRKGVEHNNAPTKTAIRLYGINKWANENNFDIVLHIHFNDYPGRKYNKPGKYSGITVYIPEKQFSNAKASKALAKTVFKRLIRYSASSDLPIENTGIVEDQELIAVGSYNTLDPAVLLVEYGYIYEPQITNPKTRTLAIKELATQTYFGVLDFFNTTKPQKESSYDTATLPYSWNNNLKKGFRGDKDVFALQTALASQKLYPPKTKSKNDCPINGNFGPCTARAVINFQKKYNIKPASGFVGPITRSKLNEFYSFSLERTL